MLGGNITLHVYESNDKDVWRVFREHHYLSGDMNKACKMYLLYWGEVLVGMASVLPIPNGTLKFGMRQHRLVILPDYQGLGFGTKINDFMAKYFYDNGYKYFIRTTHIRLGNHLSNDIKWKETSSNNKVRSDSGMNYSLISGCTADKGDKRKAYSFEYVGENYNIKEHQIIVCIGEEPKEVAERMILDIISKDKCPIIISGNANWGELTIWEKIAKESKLRTEILFIKSKGEYNINKSKLSTNFDCILTTKEAQDQISPYKENIQSMITYDFRVDPPKLWKRIKN